ncbi:MAG: H-NS histone family protein [Rhodocyclaceae bacterium]|uniref:H-NS histone family protein n=1 Tax=Sulfuricystis thermophila TaxID=2496847 RepID=UPI0010360F25|nr:H-NS histone family protein [Sulfuricystis thermophila]MDI6748805.1 H-NS histone family protein [Rhodocyclaceae bacterium]
MNLKSMSVAELNKLKKAVDKEIENRKNLQRNKALGEIKSIAAKYGLKLDELVGVSASRIKPRKTRGKKAAQPAKKKVLYRHPENPQLTWGGGRGRKPQWVKDWLAAGRSLDEAKVAE